MKIKSINIGVFFRHNIIIIFLISIICDSWAQDSIKIVPEYNYKFIEKRNLDTIPICQIEPTHTINNNHYKFNFKQLITPIVLLTTGTVGVWSYNGFKNYIRENYSIVKHGNKIKLDNYIQYLPIPFYIGLGFIPGIKHRNEWRERLMAGTSAYAVMAVISNVMKVSFREKRPDSSKRNSYPSGHSATAFTGAELLRIEYGNWVGLAGYIIASTVGALRIYNDRHWINDIFGGAAIGILSAKIGYWLLPWEKKLFKMDKRAPKASVAVVPLIGEITGISCGIEF